MTNTSGLAGARASAPEKQLHQKPRRRRKCMARSDSRSSLSIWKDAAALDLACRAADAMGVSEIVTTDPPEPANTPKWRGLTFYFCLVESTKQLNRGSGGPRPAFAKQTSSWLQSYL